ncbi:MAG: glycosyltransferase family 4 protein [Candidatus Riflebacteria bacterium]|nr:glycosyltransferase family 4 protein [Candidatus Riflebacteria bacterium]
MKILQILNSPNWSGASYYCLTLCKLLAQNGHEVLLLTEPGKPCNKAQEYGINYDDSLRLNHRNPILYVHSLKRLKTVLRSFQPDIISSHINEGAWMAGMMARKFSPHAVVIRSRSDIDPPKSHFINRFVHHQWTDHIIVTSLLHKRLCTKNLDFPQEKIDVVYGAINTEKFKPNLEAAKKFREELNVDYSTLIIGMVARLDPIKGHEYALQALRLLKAKNKKFLAIFLGYENERTFSWLHKTASQLEIGDQIRSFGFRSDLSSIINGIDIGMVTSIGSEANSRATLEFMATGKPVVATAVGVIPEIIFNEENGFLVPIKDPQTLSTSLARLLDDSSLRFNLGKQARSHIEKNFNLDRFFVRTEAIYKKVLEKRNKFETF